IAVLEKRCPGTAGALIGLRNGVLEHVAPSLGDQLCEAMRRNAFALIAEHHQAPREGNGIALIDLTCHELGPDVTNAALAQNWRACWSAPILSAEDEVLGVLMM